MPFRFSLESLKQTVEDYIHDISFPPSEIESLKPRTTIITHRVLDDADKFHKGDLVYSEKIDDNFCFEIVDQKLITKIEDSPYYKDLTNGQRAYLSKFNKISVLTLKKSKYERPYKLSTIRQKYSEKIYNKLLKDRCHAWRARTGIELIHREPDDAEQIRIVRNWSLLPEKYKKISDTMCIEIFGVTNEDHYKIIKEEKNISDDPIFHDIIAKYRQLFGFDLSHYKLISTKTPRYVNGKPANFPLEKFGGCWTWGGTVYLNSDLKPVIKFYNLKNTSVQDLKKTLISHELAHGVYNEFADQKFKDKYLKMAKNMNFTTPYLAYVHQSKMNEETFCEFVAAIICGSVKI